MTSCPSTNGAQNNIYENIRGGHEYPACGCQLHQTLEPLQRPSDTTTQACGRTSTSENKVSVPLVLANGCRMQRFEPAFDGALPQRF
jgi:hypothetical protein